MSRLLRCAVLAVCVPLGGCGSGTETTATSPAAAPSNRTPQTAQTSSVNTTSAPAGTVGTYPTVTFAMNAVNYGKNYGREGRWPFTAQLATLATSPNGFRPGMATGPEREVLMVQVNIASQISGRIVPSPDLEHDILCFGPGSRSWTAASAGQQGYDEGESAPDPFGDNVAMGDGQPHAWDMEWEVPRNTSTANVKCVFRWQGKTSKLN